MKLIKLTWEEWVEHYQPMENYLTPLQLSDPFMFETYEDDLKFIQRANRDHPEQVWTMLSEDETTWIEAGYHFVNRLGYYYTAKGFNPDNQYIVDESNWNEEEKI